MTALRMALLAVALLACGPALAQTDATTAKALDSMQTLRVQLKGDKKALVAANMDLTESEAKAFWPLYAAYQKELDKINDQLTLAIVAYAKEYKANTLTDAKATELLRRHLAIEQAEVKLKSAFVPRFGRILPGRKLARYMQLENKVRAIVKYEITAEVPLVQ